MGKWAQQKKRGSSSDIGLSPPPAPFLHDTAGDLIQDATGVADAGGIIEISEGDTEEGPWVLCASHAWDPSYNWGAVADFEGPYLSAVEIGNGIVYAGTSQRSAAFAV